MLDFLAPKKENQPTPTLSKSQPDQLTAIKRAGGPNFPRVSMTMVKVVPSQDMGKR
jgi:hypothetical protein